MAEFLEKLPSLRMAITAISVIFVDFCALMILLAAGRERRRGDKNWIAEGHGYMLAEHGLLYPLGAAELLIGRHPAADIRFSNSEISRFHAIITLADGKWYIEDLNSGCGTFVNGIRVESKTRLRRDDQIQIGRRTLIVVKGSGKGV